MAIPRQQMPQRDPGIRNRDFDEVNLGLDERLAILEAKRCLQCKARHCVAGCPVGVKIPEFLDLVARGKFAEAAEMVYADNDLPAMAGRVCPQEIQCEVQCIRAKKGDPVAVGHLERFVADWYRAHKAGQAPPQMRPTSSGFAVAVVGSGPAGLTAAGQLARMGHRVTIFEAFHRPGGVLVYGIPEFRLPKAIVDAEVGRLQAVGVEIRCNVVIGRTYTVKELMDQEGYDAVFVAVGAGLPQFMRVGGENLKGVYSSNEYLTRVNLMTAYRFHHSDTPIQVGRCVAVIGGGNTALDAVRTAKRLGAEHATIVYRRSEVQMPARIEEIHHAKEEGIEFHFLAAPVRVLGDENRWVRGMECVRMRLTEPGADGRRGVKPIEGSNFELPCDQVVVAIGTSANPLLTRSTEGLALNTWGYITIDDDGMTNLPGVFAGGDIVRGAATVILAMGDGKRAAAAIDRWLRTAKRR
ncbi:MAG: NADPH-dependent glutamate synthase [Phycisphaerae bacterium]|nr:NADPH-dependent glutamate synthase [Phycisphaerae bacterium]